MAAKFEIYKDAKGEYRFRLKAGNGEVVATGESYPTLAGARTGVEAVKRAASEADVVEVSDLSSAALRLCTDRCLPKRCGPGRQRRRGPGGVLAQFRLVQQRACPRVSGSWRGERTREWSSVIFTNGGLSAPPPTRRKHLRSQGPQRSGRGALDQCPRQGKG